MSGGHERQFVFAYGSLAAAQEARRPACLRGHRRVWGVAMDNRLDLPGYKSYRLRADGTRPAVFVAFLDIATDARAAVWGALLEVDPGALCALDARERNYERIDVTSAVDDAPGRVWTYRGSRDGRERLRHGRARGSAVVDRAYLVAVRAGFAAHGIEDDADPGPLPVFDLERRELAPAPLGHFPT